MASLFRQQVQSWATDAQHGKRVVVWINPAGPTNPGPRGSYKECRRILSTFYAMVAYERKRVVAINDKRGQRVLWDTPFEDVVCRLEKDARGGHSVLFAKAEKVLDMFEVTVTEEGGESRPWRKPEPVLQDLDALMAEFTPPEPAEPVSETAVARQEFAYSVSDEPSLGDVTAPPKSIGDMFK